MNVFVVYCHPSKDSFTYQVKEAFLEGLKAKGHRYIVSDLYTMGFNPVMSEEEYKREAFYNMDIEVPKDVVREQEKINASDVIVFIYPDFWTSSPAMLEGWFQRVWTYGFAYGPNQTMKVLDKAIFMITMGGTLNDQLRKDQLEAMKTVMLGDRISTRCKATEVYVFDRMTRGYDNMPNRQAKAIKFCKDVYDLAYNL